MFEAVGYPVQKLIRMSIGGVNIEGLKPGQSRDMTQSELQGLQAQIADNKKMKPGKQRRKGSVARKPKSR